MAQSTIRIVEDQQGRAHAPELELRRERLRVAPLPPSGGAYSPSAWEAEARSLRRVPLIAGLAAIMVGGLVALQGRAAPKAEPEAAAPAHTEEPRPAPAQVAPQPAPTPAPAAPQEPASEPAAQESATDPAPRPQAPSRRHASATGRAPSPAPAAAPVAPSTEDRIAAAVAAGWMRRSAGLLLVVPQTAAMPWDEASSYCGGRRQGGVSGWRLPALEELEALRKANGLPAGTWWSATSPGGERAYALTTAQWKPAEESKADAAARPICVRAE